MIIKGNPAGSVSWWTKHLLRDDTNTRAEVKETRGLLSSDLESALREMEAVASGSRSRGNFMYQANINPDQDLTPQQWKEAIDILEKNLKLEGHQRVVIEHEKEGRVHRHIVWNRVDVDTLKITDMGQNWIIHMKTARELEARFDHTPTPRPHAADRAPNPHLWEIRAAERSGIAPADVRAEVTEIWRGTKTGQAFKAALEERGYVLAKGERRDFCVIDQAGDVHSLARRLDGVRAAGVRERMADVDRDSLPSVAEARAIQRERFESEPKPPREPPERKTEAKPERREPTQDRKPETRAGEERADKEQERWRKSRDAHVERVEGRAEKFARGKSAYFVKNAATGTAENLADFVTGLLGSLGGSSSRPPPDQMAEMRAQRRAIAALENIQESMERGDRLSASDIQNLTPSHLENIRRHGDDGLREIIEDMERRRQRERDYGRERER
jgi:hypothetical protein